MSRRSGDLEDSRASEASAAKTQDAPYSLRSLDCRRRRFDRFGVDLDITVAGEQTVYAGFAENMSVGGLFIITHQLKRIGERVGFTIHLPDGEPPIAGQGVVRWVRAYNPGDSILPGVGIDFDGLDSEAIERIEVFLAEYEPLEYGEQ